MAIEDTNNLGIDSAVYLNEGTYGSPDWLELTCIRNVTPATPWDKVLADSRATRVKLYEHAQVDLQTSIEVLANFADTTYTPLFDAAVARTKLDILVLAGKLTVEGSRGYRSHMLVSETGETQGIGDVVYDTYELNPTYHSDGYPQSVVVGAAEAITMSPFGE